MEALAWGFDLVEAVRWRPDGSVTFSDAFGGGVHRWTPDGGVETVVPKRRGVGGLAFHAAGGVVVSGRDLVHVLDGVTRAILAPEGVTGFNDLTVDQDGSVFAGALRFLPTKGEKPVPGEVWRIESGGEASIVCSGIDWPNGIGCSPDGEVLYVSDYQAARVVACAPHGGPDVPPRAFAAAPAGSCDGLAVDESGAVWVALAAAGGIARFLPDGTLDHVLDVPATFVATVSFGGDDLRDLYIGTLDNTDDASRRGTLFRTRSDVPGVPTPPARI